MYPTMPVPSVGQSHYVTAEDFKTSQGKRDEQALFIPKVVVGVGF